MTDQTQQARSIFETIVKLLEQGAPVAMILDESSPTLDAIRDWLAADEATPTKQAASALTDERIEMFWRGAIIRNVTTQAQMLDFARSIEAALSTTAPAVGAPVASSSVCGTCEGRGYVVLASSRGEDTQEPCMACNAPQPAASAEGVTDEQIMETWEAIPPQGDPSGHKFAIAFARAILATAPAARQREQEAEMFCDVEDELREVWKLAGGMFHGQTRENGTATMPEAQLFAFVKRLVDCEEALRSLASYVGNGGYNAPSVDATAFEAKVRSGIDAAIEKGGSTLAQQVASAQSEMATWSPDKRASVQLEGSYNGMASREPQPGEAGFNNGSKREEK